MGCEAPPFGYRNQEPPRVSVVHRPLHPAAGEPIRFVARAQAGPGASVDEIRIIALLPGSGGHETVCSTAEECELDAPAGGETGVAIYRAEMTDSRGGRAASPSAYVFQIGAPAGAFSYPLRVPFDLYLGEHAFKILLVRDSGSYASERDFMQDATTMLYQGLLDDPAYRWRDDQLAFLYTTYPGRTRGYHSGVRSRCGQEPWLGQTNWAAAEAEAATADVVAVIHRRGPAGSERDCAGLGVVVAGAAPNRRLSADGRVPLAFQHELGHALASLSDEYRESTESRTTRADDLAGPAPVCRCCEPLLGPCLPGVPRCGTEFAYSPACYPADVLCPRLGSGCRNPNVFGSRTECEAAAAAIAAHPGVELAGDPSDCRLLCSGDACPCAGSLSGELWFIDRRSPAIATAAVDDDLMGELDGLAPREWNGAACEHCIETVMCLRWETARGRSWREAEAHCLVP